MVTGMTFGMKLIAMRETEANPTNKNNGQNQVSDFCCGFTNNQIATAKSEAFNSTIAIGETVGPWVPIALNMFSPLSGKP